MAIHRANGEAGAAGASVASGATVIRSLPTCALGRGGELLVGPAVTWVRSAGLAAAVPAPDKPTKTAQAAVIKLSFIASPGALNKLVSRGILELGLSLVDSPFGLMRCHKT